jgi:hypothetical protein
LPIIKPDIVFFGESLPQSFHAALAEDRNQADLLLVMGSSLKVAPVANLKDRVAKSVPQILINMESLKHMESFDIHLLGYSDIVTMALAKALGWVGEDGVEAPLGLDTASRTPSSVAGKTLAGGISGRTIARDSICKEGVLPWHWLFEGAVEKPRESDSESIGEESDGSDMTEDSNTPEPEGRVQTAEDEDSDEAEHAMEAERAIAPHNH